MYNIIIDNIGRTNILAISYNPLWKKLIDLQLNKTELIKMCNVSPTTIARMNKSLPVSLDVIDRMCTELHCNIEDIVEIKS